MLSKPIIPDNDISLARNDTFIRLSRLLSFDSIIKGIIINDIPLQNPALKLKKNVKSTLLFINSNINIELHRISKHITRIVSFLRYRWRK